MKDLHLEVGDTLREYYKALVPLIWTLLVQAKETKQKIQIHNNRIPKDYTPNPLSSYHKPFHTSPTTHYIVESITFKNIS